MINTPADLPVNFPLRCRLELDAFSDAKFLGDEARLKDVIEEVARIARMDMIKIVTTLLDVDPSKLIGDVFKDDGGVSVQGLITTSHITLHAWPQRSFFMFDLVSCKKFNRAGVVNAVFGSLEVRTVAYESYTDVADLHRRHHDPERRSGSHFTF